MNAERCFVHISFDRRRFVSKVKYAKHLENFGGFGHICNTSNGYVCAAMTNEDLCNFCSTSLDTPVI